MLGLHRRIVTDKNIASVAIPATSTRRFSGFWRMWNTNSSSSFHCASNSATNQPPNASFTHRSSPTPSDFMKNTFKVNHALSATSSCNPVLDNVEEGSVKRAPKQPYAIHTGVSTTKTTNTATSFHAATRGRFTGSCSAIASVVQAFTRSGDTCQLPIHDRDCDRPAVDYAVNPNLVTE